MADQADSTICACMIVKNESAIITRCIDSFKHLIDYWVIVDTGSTDDTKRVISNALDGVPGELIDRPWVNFGHNRSELLELAKDKADYLLLVDADMVVRTSDDFKKSFGADAYYIRSVGDIEYERHLLVRGALDWKYVGATHEYIWCDQLKTEQHLPSLWVEHHADGSTRPEKYERDVKLLTEELQQDPTNTRTIFYLAQTYRDMGDPGRAITYYKRRAAMGGWDQEVWYATYQVGCLYGRLELWPEALHWLLQAYQVRPTRAEPLHVIAERYRQRGDYHLGYLFAAQASEIPLPTDILFVQRPVYDYQIFDELAICAYYVGSHDESAQLCDWLLRKGKLPEGERQRVEENRQLALDAQQQLSSTAV